MNWPTWDQIQGVAERLITFGVATVLAWAVVKGWITVEQAKEYGIQFGPMILGIVAATYAYYRNRPTSLAQRAAALPNTTVVTTPEIARSTPEPNIVSAATNTVEPRPFGETATTADLNREEIARHQ